MMSHLLDTNVLSEVKKGNRATPSVLSWYRATPAEEMFISVIVIGEVRRGVELLRRTDVMAAYQLERWLDELLETFLGRTLPVTAEIADRWGSLSPTQRLPVADGLMAATALIHDLTLVTRNTRDFERSGARLLDPFQDL